MKPISESAFQTQVKTLAYQYGWSLHHAQPSMTRTGRYITTGAAGFPDLVLCHEEKGLIFAELKTEKGLPSATQISWMRMLSPHTECYLWRPSMLASIALRLSQSVKPK